MFQTVVTVYGKRGHFTQTKKIEFFMLIKSYNLSQLSAKILEGKTFDAQRNGDKRSLHRVLFSFQSVSQPVLSESLATLLHVVVNFQPEVSCRLHALFSKLCRFFSCSFETPPIPHLLYFENKRE